MKTYKRHIDYIELPLEASRARRGNDHVTRRIEQFRRSKRQMLTTPILEIRFFKHS
ncbi:MAG TPA: hypothetical protein VF597_00230 [Candidatus Saccharimonadales bacterium]